jgi:hypothetical protein
VKLHEASHALPVSNGWGSSSGRGITVWCGRCKDAYAADEEWVNRYYDAERRDHERGRAFDPVEGRRLTLEESAHELGAIEDRRAAALRIVRRAAAVHDGR